MNAGDIKINGIAADWFSEVIGAGNINISDSSFLKSEIISKTGNVDIRNTNLDMVVIEANVGNVKLDAAEDLDRYGIDCKVYTGNTETKSQLNKGDLCKIKVYKTTEGDYKIPEYTSDTAYKLWSALYIGTVALGVIFLIISIIGFVPEKE